MLRSAITAVLVAATSIGFAACDSDDTGEIDDVDTKHRYVGEIVLTRKFGTDYRLMVSTSVQVPVACEGSTRIGSGVARRSGSMTFRSRTFRA